MSSSLSFRLLGISIASFSSGLGEMTYLQLSTLYTNPSTNSTSTEKKGLNLSSTALGWFASGTGAAGLVGAGLWWFLRSLGVREGLLITSVCSPLTSIVEMTLTEFGDCLVLTTLYGCYLFLIITCPKCFSGRDES